jgi:hypothetical protein
LHYSIIHDVQSKYPGFIEQFVQGLSRLSMEDPLTYEVDQQLGFHVEARVPFPLRLRFQRMLERS